MMVIECVGEEKGLFFCGDMWHKCLIVEKRLTGTYVIRVCGFCCSVHHNRRILVTAEKRAQELRTLRQQARQ